MQPLHRDEIAFEILAVATKRYVSAQRAGSDLARSLPDTIHMRIDGVPVTARDPSPGIERADMERCLKLVRPNYECTRETIYLIGFGSTITQPIRRAGQEHIHEVTFKDVAIRSLYLA
jgi:hypothetical protein